MKRLKIYLLLSFVLCVFDVSAQTTDYLTRYVATQAVVDGTTYTGSYSNDGLSWKSPKANIQDAINDLHEYMTAEGITDGGKVYVASGTYTPTESTEESGGTTLNLSFKIYAGITVYGGFNADNPEATPGARCVVDRDGNDIGTIASHTTGKYLTNKYPTILSGNLNTNRKSSLTWNESQQKFTSVMPGNVYHVVTFATNGFNSNTLRANALSTPAAIDGFTIQYGNANNTDASNRYHTAYGGGVYAVANATVINCEIRQCSAARDGGGVYCDGGGTVKQCYIHTCQAVGIGIQYGNGGGVMLDGAGFVNTTVIANNFARQGGGLAMTDADNLGNNGKYSYQATASASLVANNTASSEGGGIYMEKGGAINGMSIYRNRCNGTGITIDGLTNGQSAGIFAGPMSRIYNSALWGGNINGGDTDADQVQYATSANEGDDRSRLYFCMLSHHDMCDWTYTYKKDVSKLEEDNEGSTTGDYISLINPCDEVGVASNIYDNDAYLKNYSWQPRFYSAIANAGIQLMDIPDEAGVNVNSAKLVTDLFEQAFSVDTDLGAIVAEQQNSGYSEDVAYYDGSTTSGTVYTIFVDPNRSSGKSTNADKNSNTNVGESWDNPMKNARKALALFQSWKDSEDSKWNSSNKYQILVKQGTLYTPISTGSGRARKDSWWLDDNVAVVGGYPTGMDGIDISRRQPTTYKTYISGNVSDDGFDYCSANLVQIGNVTGAILDGFTLTMGNSVSKEVVGWSNGHGAGIVVRNDSTMYDKYNDSNWSVNGVGGTGEVAAKNMVNTIRNCVFCNLGGYEGAAIYMTAQSGTTSKVIMENCIFRNCGTNFDKNGDKTTDAISSTDGKNHSIVYVGENTTLYMDHCDVLKNVGYGVIADNGGSVQATNSVFYANLDREVTETDNFNTKTDAKLLAPVKVTGTTLGTFTNCSYNLFDAKSGWTDNTGISTTDNAILDYDMGDGLSTTYPRFADPTTNCGITEAGGDVTYYGGSASFKPLDMNPMTNAANTTKLSVATDGTVTIAAATHSASDSWGTDLHLQNRDYGGLPDIGAVENDDTQSEYGAVLYVRDYRKSDGTVDYTKGGDGSSWSLAINGNAQYNQSTGALVGETQTAGTTINGLQFAVNKQSMAGGSKEVWVAAGTYAKDNETTTSASQTYGYATDKENNGAAYGDESCFIIRDNVNVYGAFPKNGNPSKDERQALLSQYVMNTGIYSYSDYETILQPLTTTMSVNNTRRVLGQPYGYCPAKTGYSSYSGALWDGFTIRYGYIDASKILTSQGNGGAGATVYYNVTLKNCIVTNNTIFAPNGSMSSGDGYRGGGMLVRGGTVEECYIINNTLTDTESSTSTTSSTGKSGVAYGGGVYFNSGTMFNCVIAKNHIVAKYADGAGFFIDGAVNCFNNTIVNNKAEGTSRMCGGVALWTSNTTTSNLQIFNTIIANNEGEKIQTTGNKNIGIQNNGVITLTNCFTEVIPDGNNYTNGSSKITFLDCQAKTGSSLTSVFNTLGSYDDDFTSMNLRLVANSAAINVGLETPTLADGTTVDLTTYTDMDYAVRIQDCAIDIGAYEYNGAQDITPDVDSEPGTAFFYVSQNGRGDRTGVSADNAACMEKIQKVLDAAGRYKYQNAGMHVVVKLAKIDDGTYTPQRSVEPAKDDPRSYSILVPRGVELWGGYTDAYDADEDINGFAEESRSIMANQTIINGNYNVDGSSATAYHVIEFTDYVFDADGYPYTTSDQVGGSSSIGSSNTALYSSMENLRLMSDVVSGERAVVDGIFIEQGAATAGSTTSATLNENQYGGGVIINSFGHVRNCVLKNNDATNGGGAVYIKQGGIISGCLLTENHANYGGAIYVEQLEDEDASEEYPEEMAQIVTCTVVGNVAYVAGGGIWFYNNTRVNSSVFWNNNCSDQANVSGQTSAEYKGTVDENSIYMKYPFSYSAVQNVRLAGTNNISVSTENNKGVRFLDTDFYAIDDYSVLNNVAMPITLYQNYIDEYDVAEQDYAKVYRITDGSAFVDIGARSNEALTSVTPVSPDQLLLRLYVAEPADVDYTLMQAMRNSGDAIYSKIGSSFAYPMQHLDDALEYIRNARQSDVVVGQSDGVDVYMKDYAANLPFEIIMSQGTYYPQLDIQGNYGYSNSNTFLIPEGVSILGGMECGPYSNYTEEEATTFNTANAAAIVAGTVTARRAGALYYGQDKQGKSKSETYSYDIYSNTDPLAEVEVKTSIAADITGGGEMLSKGNRVQLVAENKSPRKAGISDGSGIYDEGSGITGITMVPSDILELKKGRERSDNNANGIYEPWEFKNQTILSGKIVNSSSTSGNNAAYHVITIIADEKYTGERPKLDATATSTLKTGKQYSGYTTSATGTVSHEMGQGVFLDGLQIQDGYAAGYLSNAVIGNAAYSYYHGGGILVDGNWYSTTGADRQPQSAYMHTGMSLSVAYRDIPLGVMNCVFVGNTGGFGGAISSNSTVRIYNSTFSQNIAVNGEDTSVSYINSSTGMSASATVQYPGVGGCIFATKYLSVLNTLFANNESKDTKHNGTLATYSSLRNSTTGTAGNAYYGGAGGTIFAGQNSTLHLMNCDFVRNKSTFFPAVYTMHPNWNTDSPAENEYNEIINCVFWGNESTNSTKFSDMVVNMAKKATSKPTIGNTTSTASYPNEMPSSQSDMDSNFAPTIWFSAYEEGTAVTPMYTYDLREAKYDMQGYIPDMLKKEAVETQQLVSAEGYVEQNSNIILDEDNDALTGPDFSSPSVKAGANGYMASADWSLSRANNIVDNGWGKLDQNIDQAIKDDFIDYSAIFFKKEGNKYVGTGAYYTVHYADDIATFYDSNFTTEDKAQMGDDENNDRYMFYTTTDSDTGEAVEEEMFRISHDPNPTHQQTYIDMGVYEYVHTELEPVQENAVDILWVSTEEKLENGAPDGSCWEQPTSDLQRAIETLLASRNGHAKEIRITDGDYSPIYTMGDDKLLTFYINTEDLNAQSEIPSGTEKQNQYVKSLRISGGWAKDWKMTDDSERSIDEYPAVIHSAARSGVGTDKLNSVFLIEDARQWYGVTAAGSNKASLTPTTDITVPSVIPITIDGVELVNDNAQEGKEGSAFKYADQGYFVENSSGNVVQNEEDLGLGVNASGNVTITTKDGTTTSDSYTYHQAAVPTNGDLRLTLDHIRVSGSGNEDEAVSSNASLDNIGSSAFIGTGGGDALIYNSLFSDNYNHPLKASDTRVVNCTFAQNQGIVQLFNSEAAESIGTGGTGGTTGPMLLPEKDESREQNAETLYSATSRRKSISYSLGSGSCMHNSVLWKNNLAGIVDSARGVIAGIKADGNVATTGTAIGNGTQILFCDASQNYWTPTSTKGELEGSGQYADYYKYTFTTQPFFTYNAISDTYHYNEKQSELHEKTRGTDDNENCGLSLDNSDAIYGPNFTDVENTTILDRDYQLLPSVRLMNTGSNDTYTTVVGTNPTMSYTTVVSFNDAKTVTNRETTTTVTDSEGKTSTTTTTTVSTDKYDGDTEGVFSGYETELGSEKRVQAVTIDRGAYEYQEALTRVVYVDPSQRDGKGTSWDETYSSLQKAIDLVAVYYNTYKYPAYVFAKVGRMNENIILRDGVEIYGSIPRSYSNKAGRNGTVELTPGAASSNTDWPDDNDLINAYVRQVRNVRDGLAVPSSETTRTVINGLSNSSSIYSTTSLVDGFDIHGGSSEGITKVTSPVINLTSSTGKFVIRNCIVRDNIYSDVSLKSPVAYLGSQALLYNVLFRNNATQGNVPVIQMANENAYAVNISVNTSSNYAVGVEKNETDKYYGHLVNSLTWSSNNTTTPTGIISSDTSLEQVNNNAAEEGNPFTEYLTSQGIYANYPNIWYQLSENSLHIDKCTQTITKDASGNITDNKVGDDTNTVTIPSAFNSYIDYGIDRDVLGNPRRIDATSTGIVSYNASQDKVDRGCFETWRVGSAYTNADPTSASATTAISTISSSTVYKAKDETNSSDYHTQLTDITTDFKYYPHTGSVVYVMPSSSLVLGEYTYVSSVSDGVTTTSAANPLRDYRNNGNEYVFRPAYLLMKVGASLYGQGNNVSVPYLSVERYFSNGTSNTYYNGLMALPFSFNYGEDPKTVTYATTTCIPSLTESKDQPVYLYNPSARSAWDNIFHSTASEHWNELTGSDRERSANEGVLFTPSLGKDKKALYRFSAITSDFTSTSNDVYSESQKTLTKTVTLTQNDDRESTDDAADFTSKEDMGWNCLGLPYLIGKYQTAATATSYAGYPASGSTATNASSILQCIAEDKAAPNAYMLHVPHELWLYYNDTDAYEKKNSWEKDASDAMPYLMSGEGFFTQTAAINSTETLTFTLPIWLRSSPVSSAKSSLFNDQSLNSIPGVRLGGTPEEETNNDTAYRVYSTQGTIHVKGLIGTEQIRIYTTSGALYTSTSAPEDEYSHSVAPGTYIVRINNQSWKLLVR